MPAAKEVFSVRVGHHVYCLPDDEPISGFTRALPAREILNKVMACTAGIERVTDDATRDAFSRLRGNRRLPVRMTLKDPADAEQIEMLLDRGNSSDLRMDGTGFTARVNFPAFLRLCRSDLLARVQLNSQGEGEAAPQRKMRQAS